MTGLAAIAARNSADMIGKLNRGLTMEVAFVAAFIGLAFRSAVVMLVSILPAIFPIVLSGTLLWTMGEGLQFASVVALTVSFGLGLSATIHFLNRLRLEHKPDEDPGIGVQRATVLVGPALILTSVVLACGLAVTVFSDLPSLRLFGWLSAFAMLAALVADLTILRPTTMFLHQLVRRIDRREHPPQEAKAKSRKVGVREARIEAAERSARVVDLRDAEAARLEMLNEALNPLFAKIPEGIELFDRGISKGDVPRLWIDMIAHVEMGKDKRIYRFVQDTCYGRKIIAESYEVRDLTDAVTRYVAGRMVER